MNQKEVFNSMKIIFSSLSIVVVVLFGGCSIKNKKYSKAPTVNHHWLDSIIKNSDSAYDKPYKRSDFVTAFFYTNKKDSSICQVMKDSLGRIRQIIIARNNIRTFFASYFNNANLEANLPLDKFGQYHGTTTFYYASGNIQSTGYFKHGLKVGEWKTFDEKGKCKFKEMFNENGQAGNVDTY